ncbi:MAG: hypothetical protein KAQ68_05560 [Clostridiales bacterium]|nr:hypothetical protein [Clostridiales bacterium]
MGTIRRCRKCGTVFDSYGYDLCTDCAEELDKTFNLVQDYIYDHEDANVVEISKALDIDGKIILDFLKEGNLALSENNRMLNCEKCGKAIQSGKYCEECSSNLENIFNSAISAKEETQEEKKKVRMHVRFDK